MDLTHFQFENRSRATRCRFLQSFAVPDEAAQFQQSWGTLRRVTWFGLSPPSSPSSTNMCVCMCMCMCMSAYVYVYECVRVLFMTFHNSFMFLLHLAYIYFFYHQSSRTPQHSEWNCVGTDRPQHMHMYGHCVWLNFEHTKNSKRSKKICDEQNRIRIC